MPVDTRTAPYAAFILRLGLGILFLAHAGLKIFVSRRLERRLSLRPWDCPLCWLT